MYTFETGFKREDSNANAQLEDVTNTRIQPFQQMPSVNNTGDESAERINAHDLFSFYTADIIKKDVIFIR